MRQRREELAREYADRIRPLLGLARRAYGQQKAGSPARDASDQVNTLLLEYDAKAGNITELAEQLDGEIGLAGLRRRLRIARTGRPLGQPRQGSFRGNRDPERITEAADRIKALAGTPGYGAAVKDAYEEGLALSAIAKALDCSYFTLWSSMSTAA